MKQLAMLLTLVEVLHCIKRPPHGPQSMGIKRLSSKKRCDPVQRHPETLKNQFSISFEDHIGKSVPCRDLMSAERNLMISPVVVSALLKRNLYKARGF